MDLKNNKCVPCEGGVAPLTAQEIAIYSKEVQGWSAVGEKEIQKEFIFKTFKPAIAFVNRVAEIAEAEGHHPDIAIHYNRVIFSFTTHAIEGLSNNDFIMAAKIDELPISSD